MKKGLRQVQISRTFTEEFKRQRVKEYERGEFTVGELSKLYHVSSRSIYVWIHKYSSYPKRKVRIVEMAESSTLKLKEMQARIKELEQIVGQKQIKIDYLEKMIDIASEEFDIDIEKKRNTLPLNGLEKIKKA